MSPDPRLRNLFVEGLRLLYAAHHQGSEQAKENIGSSSLPKLKQMLTAGSELNLVQAKRLEPIFKAIGRDVETRTDPAMSGIIASNKAMVAKADGRVTRDLANIGSGQVAAHFYISTYGTLRAYARALGFSHAITVFDRTLAETRKIDRDFTALAARIIADAGKSSYPSESALYTTAALHPARTAATGFALVAAAAVAVVALVPAPVPPPRGVRRLWSR